MNIECLPREEGPLAFNQGREIPFTSSVILYYKDQENLNQTTGAGLARRAGATPGSKEPRDIQGPAVGPGVYSPPCSLPTSPHDAPLLAG